MANKVEIRDYNFITIQGWMVNRLELSGNELIVYAVIYGFSQTKNQWASTSQVYLAEWANASLITIKRTIKSLEEKGLIKKRYATDEIGRYAEYKAIVPENAITECSASKYQNDTMSENKVSKRDLPKYQNDTYQSINLINDTIKNNIEYNIEYNIEDKSSARAPKKAFVKPTVEEIAAYIQEKKYNINPEQFFNYYESNGWKVGRNPMKNWKSAVNTWAHNGFSNNSTRKSTSCGNNSPAGFDEMFE